MADNPNTVTPFRLFDLPTELVQYILFFAQGTDSIKLHPKGRGNLASSSPLMLLSKHMHQEYLASLFRHATVIEAHVHNFDFRNLVAFFNRLSDQEIKGFASKADEAETRTSEVQQATQGLEDKRKIHVILDIDRYCDWMLLGSSMERWIKRAGKPTKRGTEVAVSYYARPTEELMCWENRGPWRFMVNEYVKAMEGKPEGAEMRKILEAVMRAFEESTM